MLLLRNPPALANGSCNRNDRSDKEKHHEERKPKGNVVEMTTRNRPILLCVDYKLAFDIHILSKVGYETVSLYLSRPS